MGGAGGAAMVDGMEGFAAPPADYDYQNTLRSPACARDGVWRLEVASAGALVGLVVLDDAALIRAIRVNGAEYKPGDRAEPERGGFVIEVVATDAALGVQARSHNMVDAWHFLPCECCVERTELEEDPAVGLAYEPRDDVRPPGRRSSSAS